MANAQKIVSDNTSSDGIRTIIGECVTVRSISDKVVFQVGLCASLYKDNTSYSLVVKSTSSTPYTIKKGMKLLLRDKSEELVTLVSNGDYDASVREVHNANGFVYSDYSKAAFYDVSKDIIAQLCNGVLKIGQEHSTGRFDKTYKKDKIGKVLKEEFDLIQKALENPNPNNF
jgi:hypothetical protein